MAPQASKKCGPLLPDHEQIGCCASNGINMKRYLDTLLPYRELPRMTPQVRMKTPIPPASQNGIATLIAKSITRETFSSIFSAYHAALGWTNRMKSIAIILFAILLFTGSACTKVSVTVHNQATSGSGLTGLNCKLKRELKNQHQQSNVWCWAASAHTVLEYLKNEEINQRDILQAVFTSQLTYEWNTKIADPRWSSVEREKLKHMVPSTCWMKMPEEHQLKDPVPIEEQNILTAQQICFQNGYADWVFATEEFHATYTPIWYEWTSSLPHGLGWGDLVKEICSDRPIISIKLYASNVGSGAHAVVIGGYSELEDGSQWVHVYDPSYNTEETESYIEPYHVYLGDPGVFTHAGDYKNISVQ